MRRDRNKLVFNKPVNHNRYKLLSLTVLINIPWHQRGVKLVENGRDLIRYYMNISSDSTVELIVSVSDTSIERSIVDEDHSESDDTMSVEKWK